MARLYLWIFSLLLAGFSQAIYCQGLIAGQAGLNLNDEGFVLHGYDPVAYFDEGPKPGNDSFTASHAGMNFRFSSAENRARFMDSLETYIPAYGGYCAFGVRMGSKFDIDPEAYEILDGQLYVLLNRATEELWLEDSGRNIEIANSLWPSIQNIAPDKL